MSRLWVWVVATVAVSVAAFGAVLAAGFSPLLGLDLQGGISVVYRPAHHVSTSTLDQTITIIRNRVDALGVAEPNISRSGDNISVQLPGVKDRSQALSIIGQTAQLRFRQVVCPTSPNGQALPPYVPPKPLPKGQAAPTLTGPLPSCAAATSSAAIASVPSSSRNAPVDAPVLLPLKPVNGVTPGRYILGPALASGTIIKNATAAIDPNTGQWLVNFTLTNSGSPTFDSIAQRTYHQQLGIVLDGVVESAPTINAQSFHGSGQITGTFTQAQADSLALELRYGALPVQLVQQTVQSVSPTLGKASLNAGILAAIVGLALVFGYTVLYYRALGLVVLLGLAITGALLWAIISYLGHTQGLALDLSGITGLIVSVGVVVDSYIVFFERLKDEVRSGKTIRSSVQRGFTSAFRTIVAADLVSLIGAIVLYFLSVGQVRGFALYLGLSTILDLITAWTFTRPLVILLGRNRVFTEARWLGVARGLASPAASPA